MKKIILFTLIFISSFSLSACIPQEDTPPDDNQTPVDMENSGLGQSVNIVLADSYNDFIEGYSVLDPSKVADITVRTTNEEDTYIEEFSSTSIRDLKSSSSVGFSFGVGVKGEFNGMFAGVSSEFKNSSSFEYNSYSSQYFYVYEKSVLKNRMYFQNYLENDYQSMLSSSYLSALEALENNTMTYEEFFNRYGSHLIVSAYYGGRLNAYYSVVTNSSTFNSEEESFLQTTAKAGVTGVGSTEASLSQSIATELNVSTEDIETSFTAKAIGGSTFTGSSLSDFASSQASWSDSFNSSESYVLMDYADDGLIGLWDILPVEYIDLQDDMIDAFDSYYEANIEDMLLSFSNTGNVVKSTIYTSADAGFGVRNIYDDGIYGLYDTYESADHLSLIPLMGFADEDHIFRFDITIQMSEINNGYQEVWLYHDDIETIRTNSLTATRKDAQSNGMVTGVNNIDFAGDTLKTVADFVTITLFARGTDITETMYLRYDASGDGDDTWKLYNVEVVITAYEVTEILNNPLDRTIIDTGSGGLGVTNNEKTDILQFSNYSEQLTEDYLFTIILAVDMKQIDNGYQGFYLYYNNTETSNEVVPLETQVSMGLVNTLYDFDFPTFYHDWEYGYTEKDVSISTVYVPIQVRGDQLLELMYLRYDASGDADDDWLLDNIVAYVYVEELTQE